VLRELALVGIGGFVGSVLRFLVSGWAQRAVPWAGLPLGTLAVNVLGCLLIGLLGGLAEYRQALDPGQRLFWMVGLLGGFTTFSAFGYETLALAQDGGMARALMNVALQVMLGCGAAAAGYIAARFL